MSLESTTSVLCHHHPRGYLYLDSTCNYLQEAFKSTVMQAIISWTYVINASLKTQYNPPESYFCSTTWNSAKSGKVSQATLYCSEFNRTVSSPSNDTFHMFCPLPRMWACRFPPCYTDVLFPSLDSGRTSEAPGGLWHCPKSVNKHRIPQTEDIPHMELSQYRPSRIGNHLPAFLCFLVFHLLNSQPGSGKSLAKRSALVKHLVLDETIS